MRYTHEVMIRPFAAVSLVALFAACVTYDSATGVDGGGGGSSGLSSSGTFASDATVPPQDSAALMDGAVAADGGNGECTSIAQAGQVVPLTLGAGSAPAAIGGVASGTFALTSAKVYAPLLPVQRMLPATTVKVAGLSFEMIRGADSTNAGTVTVSNGTLQFNSTCGGSSELTNATFTYTATATALKLYSAIVVPGAGTFTLEYTFSKP
jgi:hypothetical protein